MFVYFFRYFSVQLLLEDFLRQVKIAMNNMRKLTSLLVLTLTGFISSAQQDAQFSHNMFNRLATNAGYAGTNNAICATLIGRSQWVSFPGAPKTGLLSIDAPILTKTPFHGGIGLVLCSDQLGYEKNLNAKLSYSYHLMLGTGTLGLGLEGGMLQKSIDGSHWLPPSTVIDNSIPSTISTITYDIGFGAYYTTNQFYVGISSLHLPQSVLTKGNFNYTNVRHYYVTGGYDFPLPGNPNIELKPSILVKSDGRSTQLDVNLLAQYNKLFWGGVSYRITDAIVALVGFNYGLSNGSNLRFGYSYDITTSALRGYSSGSHELLLGYCFKVSTPEKKQSHQNVRFLN